jgi:hypothetical protein
MPQPLRTSGPSAIPIRAWNFGRAALPSYLFAKSKPPQCQSSALKKRKGKWRVESEWRTPTAAGTRLNRTTAAELGFGRRLFSAIPAHRRYAATPRGGC